MNIKNFIFVAGLAATAALAPASAMAQAATSQVAVTSEIKVDKVVVTNGVSKHVLSTMNRVVPGDHLVFLTRYHNTGVKPAENFVVTNPLNSAVTLASDGYGNFDVS